MSSCRKIPKSVPTCFASLDFHYLWGTAISCSQTWLSLSGLTAHVAKHLLSWPDPFVSVVYHLILSGKFKQLVLPDTGQRQNDVLCINSLSWQEKCQSGLWLFDSLSSLDEATTCEISFALIFIVLSELFSYCCKVLIWEYVGDLDDARCQICTPSCRFRFFSWLGWENIALRVLIYFLPSTNFEDVLQTLKKSKQRNAVKN